ncbi:MAG TPA: HD-GYP domain-containing protein [Nitriliruptorales bacterium]|nr:HD-GYP domain-containing protein [Nitriliruptorales bacterium]
MDPRAADDVQRMQQQMLVFARELNEVIARERARRQEAEDALLMLRGSYMEMVKTLAFVVEAKDSTTRSHLDRTYHYARLLTARVGPELLQSASLHYGFLLHDVGKVGIPEAILNKPGPLTDDEWEIMRTHPLIGVQVVSAVKFLGDAVNVIRSHHERWDGKGYPEGLAGEQIHIGARIFSVVDTFDAMTSERPYKKALPVAVAMEEIGRCAGTQFDPDVAREFVQLLEERDLHSTGPTDLAAAL